MVKKTRAFGYDATVLYVFNNDLLVQIVVTFLGKPTASRFMSIQNMLSQQFAVMPAPVADNISSLHSKLDASDSVASFRLDHRIVADTPAGPREQFIIYKMGK